MAEPLAVADLVPPRTFTALEVRRLLRDWFDERERG